MGGAHDVEPALFPEVISLFFNGYDHGRSACRLGLVNPPVPDNSSRFRGDGYEVEYVTANGPLAPVVLSYIHVGFETWKQEIRKNHPNPAYDFHHSRSHVA